MFLLMERAFAKFCEGGKMNKTTTILLFFLSMALFPLGAIAAGECPDLNRDLERQLLRKSNYEIPTMGTLPANLQRKISEKSENKCLYLAELDPSIGSYGILLHEKNTDNYHLFHAVKCTCNGAKPFRVMKMAEFSGDIPMIRPVLEDYTYENTHTGKQIDLGSAWKTIFVEMVGSGEKHLYRRTTNEALKYNVD